MKLNTTGLYTFEDVSFRNVSQQKDPMVTSYMMYKVGKFTSICCSVMKEKTVFLFRDISRNYKRAVEIP